MVEQPAKRSSAVRGNADVKKAPVAPQPLSADARLNDPGSNESTEQASSPASVGPSQKRTESSVKLREFHNELSELAAKQQLGRKALQRLEQILNEAASLASKRPEYRRLYDRALQIQRRALTPPRGKKAPRTCPKPRAYAGRS